MCRRCRLQIVDASFCSLWGVSRYGWMMNTVQLINGFYVCASGSLFKSLSLLQTHEMLLFITCRRLAVCLSCWDPKPPRKLFCEWGQVCVKLNYYYYFLDNLSQHHLLRRLPFIGCSVDHPSLSLCLSVCPVPRPPLPTPCPHLLFF